jgi:hypothetical protein
MEALAAYALASGFGGSNCVSRDVFFEVADIEHDDGAVTGWVSPVRKLMDGDTSARIDPDGRIAAMPGLDRPHFMAWLETQPRWAAVKAANAPLAAPDREAGAPAPIVAPVRIEPMGGQGLALVGGDAELIFSSVDITEKEMEAIAGALNNQKPLLVALRDMVRYITSGDHQEVKNPYARPVVENALKAIQSATGFKGNWMDADQAVEAPPPHQTNRAARGSRPR